jgi:hypothetical protein
MVVPLLGLTSFGLGASGAGVVVGVCFFVYLRYSDWRGVVLWLLRFAEGGGMGWREGKRSFRRG